MRRESESRFYSAGAFHLYKAMHLASKKSQEDSRWKVVSDSLNTLALKVERLDYLFSRIGVKLPEELVARLKRILEAVEKDDISLAMKEYESIVEKINPLGPIAEYAHYTSMFTRLVASFFSGLAIFYTITAGVSGALVITAPLALIVTVTGSLALASLLLSSYYYSVYTLAALTGAIIGLAFNLTSIADIEAIAMLLGASLISIAALGYTSYVRRRIRRVISSIGWSV